MMSVKHKFYRVFPDGDFGIPISTSKVDSVSLIPDCGEITDWPLLELAVKPGRLEGPLPDFVNSNLIVRLCSRRLKDLIDSLLTEEDIVQWLPAYITDLDGNRIEHFVLHFPEPPDVLNMEPNETIFDKGSGVLIRPCLSPEKVGNRTIFNIPGLYVSTIVNERAKCAFESAGMQGMEFSLERTR